MAKQLQLRRGTTAQHSTFTGAVGEITVDTDKDVVVVHDGSTAGGFPLAKDSAVVHNSGDETVAGVKTFTGTVVLPSTTSIGTVSNTEIGYLDGVTSAIQTQLNTKAPLASPALTGTPTAPTASVNTSTTQIATTAFVNAEIANDAVPRITSTDNAIARYDGTGGAIQNSSVTIDDSGAMSINTPELVANGTFDTDTDWTKASGVTISSGVANFSSVLGSTNGLEQPIVLVSGATYIISFDITTITSGAIGVYETTEIPAPVYKNTVGTHTVKFTAIGGNRVIKLRTSGTTTATIDNISVKEVPLTLNGSFPVLQKNSSVTIDDNGNVGIGTSSPDANISMGSDSFSISNASSLLNSGKNSSCILRTDGAGTGNFANAGSLVYASRESNTAGRSSHIFYTGSPLAERMRINESGNVGIGITPNVWRTTMTALQIENASIKAGKTAMEAEFLLNSYENTAGGYQYVSDGIASRYAQNSSGSHVFSTAPSGTAGNAITWTTTMTLSASGNLGIGVTPSVWGSNFKVIDINSNSSLVGSTTDAILVKGTYHNGTNWIYKNNNNGASYIQQTGSSFYFGSAPSGTAGNAITWTTAMTLNASGNLGIGVTPSYKLHLVSDSAAKPSTNTWTISSDERLKENIELADLDRCYEIVKTIPLKRYTWKDSVYTQEQVSDRSKLGWIANDVQTVFPKAVNTHSQQLATFKIELKDVEEQKLISEAIVGQEEIKDEDGNIIQEFIEAKEAVYETITVQKEEKVYDVLDDCLDLNADQLYAVMYGAIQKLQLTVEALTARIEALEAK